MRTGIVPILKMLNERLGALRIEEIETERKDAIRAELQAAKHHLGAARALLQAEFMKDAG